MSWSYQREESTGFETRIPEGKHRVRIKSAEKAVSSSGNDMLVLQMDVSGFNETLYHYITFMKDNPSMTNRMLTQFFDSFKDIPDGQFDMSKWIGKVGACVVKHDEYNGNQKSKVSSFIPADKQGDLPAWQEPSGAAATTSTPAVETDADGFMVVPDSSDMPFV